MEKQFNMIHNNTIKRLFFLCCLVFTLVWVTIFIVYQIHDFQNGGVYITQTINGKYIVSIRGGAAENIEIVERLLKIDAEYPQNPTTGNHSISAEPQSNNARNADKNQIDLNDNSLEDTTAAYDVTSGANGVSDSRLESVSNLEKVKIDVKDKLPLFTNYQCPTNLTLKSILDVHICGDISQTKYKLLFLTTMYYGEKQLNFFYNTLRVMASMRREFNVKPVLFLESPQSFIEANETQFIETACDLGWTVLLAPHCNAYGFPVFKSMFNVTMETWNAEWYGYSNGDMLFDGTLISTLDFIESKSHILKIPMLLGRRYNLALDKNKTHLTHHNQIKSLYFTTRLDGASPIDYFMTKKGAFPWHIVPDFVVGRPVYDSWIVWYAQKAKLLVVDTTATVRAIHQNQKGLNYIQNTHKVHRVGDGMMYNKGLASELAKRNKAMKLNLAVGYLSCLPLKLIKMQRHVLYNMVANGDTSIVGRGKDHHPIETDDQEYLSAIKLFNTTGRQANSSEADLSVSYESDSRASTRRLLNKAKLKKKSINQTNSAIKSHNSTDDHKRERRDINATLLHQDQVENLKQNKTSVADRVTTTSSSTRNTIDKIRNRTNVALNVTVISRNITENLKTTTHSPTVSNTTTPPPKKVQLTRGEQVSILNHQRGFKEPAMIPFIGESEDYVFVLVRRTSYLEWRTNYPGFKGVPFAEKCQNKQNIDMELSELVTF